jgi:hypothetical protein
VSPCIWFQLGRTSPLGHARALSSSPGGLRRFGGRAGVRGATGVAQSVSHRRRAAPFLVREPAAVPPAVRRGPLRHRLEHFSLSPNFSSSGGVHVREVAAAVARPHPAYRGPYRVRVPGQKYFVIEISGRPQAVSVDKIKPHLGSTPISAALGPHRGRPPKLGGR